MSDKLQTQVSHVSIDAAPWSQLSPGQTERNKYDDPSGARPRTGPRQQEMASSPQKEQLSTGQESIQTSSSWKDLSREEFIKKYSDKLPKELKVPYFDVMLLYSEEDREETEHFREHLENDIFPEKPGKIRAVLYDGPDFEGLSTSKLQHLEAGFKRSTFTFVFLTKKFVECDWCALSSETCLIEAIYNKDKKWCVVPVYTVQRNKADFRIPMGLNSLKGINYYNPDEFYRKGVKRLIGDKIIKREENEEKREQECYQFLLDKVRKEELEDGRKNFEHRINMQEMEKERQRVRDYHAQMMPRSQSEEYATREAKHQMYYSGQPRTAGLTAQPPNFPSDYFRGPSEHSDLPSIASPKPEWKPKPDIEYSTQHSMPSSSYPQPSIPYDKQNINIPPQSAPSSLDSSHLSNDYMSEHYYQGSRKHILPTEMTGNQQEIHYHYHLGPRNQQETVPNTFNINADNVIIGENAKIIADGKMVNPEANNSNERVIRSADESVGIQSSVLNGRGGSGVTSSTVFPDNGFSTAQSNSGFSHQANAVEHSETETPKKKQLSLNIPPNSKEDVTLCKSGDDELTREKSTANEKFLSENKTKDGLTMSGNLEKENRQNIAEVTPNIPVSVVNPQKASAATSTRKPIKPFKTGQTNVALVAPYKPVAAGTVFEQHNISANDSTEVKQPVASHQTSPKVLNTDSNEDETQLKTSDPVTQKAAGSGQHLSPLLGCSQNVSELSNTFAPQSFSSEETEVLKPCTSGKKGSQSSLETDGFTSYDSSNACVGVLTKDELEIQAVKVCLGMGYTEEQIHDALLLLKRSDEKHHQQRHHYSINELLDALNGKTRSGSSKNKGSGDFVEEGENWVTIKKDEQSGECIDIDSPPEVEESGSSNPARESASDTNLLSSQRPKSKKEKKDGCRMS